jgi:hypothetical protein
MRLAVALPSLEAAAPQRRAIDAMLGCLVDAGHEVEGFAEHDRTGDASPFAVYHYLRMGERHRTAPFDTALYPLGRDASPYQSAYGLMQRFPGVVWFIDAVAHHLVLGGIALMGDWAAYRRLLDDAYGNGGAAVAQTVAGNWGTGALFRRYDLVRAVAASQAHVLAAWPALARRIAERLGGRAVDVVPLGLESDDHGDEEPAASSTIRSVAVMSVNESYATSSVRAAAAALELDEEMSLRLCVSEPVYKAEARPVAEHLGVHERIEWRLTTSPRELAEVAADSDVLAWFAEELQGGHHLQLLRGMAAGKLTVVPRCRLYDDLPAGAVAKLDLGRCLAPSFASLLRSLDGDADLRSGLAAAGRSFARACAGPAAAAELLVTQLDAAGLPRPAEAPVSARSWESVRAAVLDAVLPAGATELARQRIDEALHEVSSPARAEGGA